MVNVRPTWARFRRTQARSSKNKKSKVGVMSVRVGPGRANVAQAQLRQSKRIGGHAGTVVHHRSQRSHVSLANGGCRRNVAQRASPTVCAVAHSFELRLELLCACAVRTPWWYIFCTYLTCPIPSGPTRFETWRIGSGQHEGDLMRRGGLNWITSAPPTMSSSTNCRKISRTDSLLS